MFKKSENNIIAIFIFISFFFVPYIGYSKTYIYLIVAVTYFLFKKKVRISKSTILILNILVFSLIIGSKSSNFEYLSSIFLFLNLFILKILNLSEIRATNKEKKVKRYMHFAILFLTIQIIYNYNEFLKNPFSYFNLNGYHQFGLLVEPEKNHAAVILYLFFMLSNKLKYRNGIILTILLIPFVDSRGYILMITLFYVVKRYKRVIYNILKKLRLNNIFNLSLVSVIIILIFSYMFLKVVPHKAIVEGSLGDSSNYIRFNANIYALKDIIKNKLIFFGNDRNLLLNWGIFDGVKLKTFIYNGSYLVQPHSSFLNILVRIGILPFIIYIYILNKIMNRFFHIDNIEYILPYFIQALFLHKMIEGKLLILYVFVLAISNTKISLKVYKGV